MKDWLKRLWNGPVVAETVHPAFGSMQLTRIRGSEVWTADRVPFEEHTISVFFNTSQSKLPSDAQIRFFRDVTEDLDSTFNKVASVLVPTFEKIYGAIEGRWNNTFKLAGIEVPLEANPSNPWLLQYETLNHRGELFTVYFRNGTPAEVGYDS